jgi:hypothetical protein
MNQVIGWTAIAAIASTLAGLANSLTLKIPEIGLVCFIVATVSVCGLLIYIGVRALDAIR